MSAALGATPRALPRAPASSLRVDPVDGMPVGVPVLTTCVLHWYCTGRTAGVYVAGSQDVPRGRSLPVLSDHPRGTTNQVARLGWAT